MCNPAAAAFFTVAGTAVAAQIAKPKRPPPTIQIPEPAAKGETAVRAEESARSRLLSEQEAGKTRRRRLRLRGATQEPAEIGLKIPII